MTMMWQCHLSSSECRCYRLNGFSLFKRLPIPLSSGSRPLEQSVGEWLESIGLQRYESKLLLNGFDDVRFLVSAAGPLAACRAPPCPPERESACSQGWGLCLLSKLCPLQLCSSNSSTGQAVCRPATQEGGFPTQERPQPQPPAMQPGIQTSLLGVLGTFSGSTARFSMATVLSHLDTKKFPLFPKTWCQVICH